MDTNSNLKKTPLNQLHHELKARMVDFSGYEMPVQYPLGVLKEHQHTRQQAGLFDVSHMGQVFITGDNADQWIETLVPGNITDLKDGAMRYTMLTNKEGYIYDDLIVSKLNGGLFVVVNAGCKEQDIALFQSALTDNISMKHLGDRALIALQGPKAVDVLKLYFPEVEEMNFMTIRSFTYNDSGKDAEFFISRSGYTGEDGFEISIPTHIAEEFSRRLLKHEEVEAIGLGARDSLRLEAGLCLYGHDITLETTPIEASLAWSIGKRRRAEGGFPGAEIILKQLNEGNIDRKRVGILPTGRAPAREGTKIYNQNNEEIGVITSGSFGPTYGGPIAMGYVQADNAADGQPLLLDIRGRMVEAKIAKTPFVPQNYFRKK